MATVNHKMSQFNRITNWQNEVNPRESNRGLRFHYSSSSLVGADQRVPDMNHYQESVHMVPTNDDYVGVYPGESVGPSGMNIYSSTSFPGTVQRFPSGNEMEEEGGGDSRSFPFRRRHPEDYFSEYAVGESSSTGAQTGIPRRQVPPYQDNVSGHSRHLEAGIGYGASSTTTSNQLHRAWAIMLNVHEQTIQPGIVAPCWQSSSNPSHPAPSRSSQQNLLAASILLNSTSGNQRSSVGIQARGNSLRNRIRTPPSLDMIDSIRRRNEIIAAQENQMETGLKEQQILSHIGREIFQSITEGTPQNEVCCICQENYVSGEELGKLDCRHKFHLACIKQWLVLKNTCPICKRMALARDEEEQGDE